MSVITLAPLYRGRPQTAVAYPSLRRGGLGNVRRSRRRAGALLALLLALSMIAAACGGYDDNNNASTDTTEAGTPTKGGDVVFAAEQEPDVMDWIDANAGASWGVYTVQANTMPRAF